MLDKDSFLIEQAYREMLNKRLVKETYKYTPDPDHSYDFQDYMQECMRAAFEEINQDAKLHAELKAFANKIGADVSPDASAEELYYALPPDCEPCKRVTEYLQQAEQESTECWSAEGAHEETLRDY